MNLDKGSQSEVDLAIKEYIPNSSIVDFYLVDLFSFHKDVISKEDKALTLWLRKTTTLR